MLQSRAKALVLRVSRTFPDIKPMDEESVAELNPLTRWQIGGASGGGVDADVPPQPVFGLNLAGQGTIALVAVLVVGVLDESALE